MNGTIANGWGLWTFHAACKLNGGVLEEHSRAGYSQPGIGIHKRRESMKAQSTEFTRMAGFQCNTGVLVLQADRAWNTDKTHLQYWVAGITRRQEY